MRPTLALAALLLALPAVALVGSAGVDNCSTAATLIPPKHVPLSVVPQSNAWMQLNPSPTCVPNNNPLYVGTAPPCPASGGVFPGELCGGVLVPPGGQIVCTWLPVGVSTVVDLYVGFDRDGNGHLWDGSDPPGYRTIPAGSTALLANNAGVPARWIAMPVSALIGGSPLDTTIVGCQ